MKIFLKKALCGLLCILLIVGSAVSAFAADAAVTPVIVINDINANPLIDTTDDTVVFNFKDFEYDVLFTDGFSSNILDIFSEDIISQIKDGSMTTTDLINVLTDYLGFSGDINTIVNKVLEIATGVIANIDTSNIDISAIISSIDFKGMIQEQVVKIEQTIDNFNTIKMNDDGTSANPDIGVKAYPKAIGEYRNTDDIAGEIGMAIASEIDEDNTYVFTYDWRLDPIANASLLDDYIENVKSETGSDKVSIISEGYGSVIATTYLAKNKDAADSVKNFVTVSSEFLGTSLMGDYFKGDIVNEHTDINSFTSAYIRYTNDISDNPITSFSTWLTNYVLNREWEVQEFCYYVEQMLGAVNAVLNNHGFAAELAKMPGLWALVPSEDYYDAESNLLKDDNAIKTSVEKYKDYQDNYDEILKDAKTAGINVSVVASWDLQIFPLGENHSVQSDGVVDTQYASFGATCVEINSVTEAMNTVQDSDTNHDHLSDSYDMLTPLYSYGGRCHYIDASTCALPENTWFIKNMKHGTFSGESNSMDFLIMLITADSEKTVWQDVAYQQFMQYNRFINPGILTSNGVTATIPTPGKYLLGDINLDGKVTAIDSRLALRHAAGLDVIDSESLAFKNGDVFADGVINAADARKILMMACGLEEGMQSGIDFDYVSEQGALDKSSYGVQLEATYNSIKNQMSLSVVIPDAVGSYCGSYAVKYDDKMLTYNSVETAMLAEGYAVAGQPENHIGTVTCGFSTEKSVTKEDCNKDGDLILATFVFDVSRKTVTATQLSVGATHFYDNGEDTFVTPFTLNLDKDFFMMLGDANDDRYITADDARFVLRVSARLEKITDDAMFKRCDVDKDGKITAKDARLILRASAQLITSYEENDAGYLEQTGKI